MKELNESLYKYIYDNELYLEDFETLKVLTDYILSSKVKLKFDYKFKNRIGLESSKQIVNEFLDTINTDYSDYLNKKWDSCEILLREDDGYPAITYLKDDKSLIDLPVSNCITDAYAIIHEIIHDMKIKCLKTENCYAFDRLCESLAILGEFLLEDYLSQNKFYSNDIYINKKQILSAIYVNASQIDFEYFLIKTFIENGYVNRYDIYKYISAYSQNKDIYKYQINQIRQEDYFSIDILSRNIYGFFLACYMHDRILQDFTKIEEFLTINELIDKMDLYDILRYIDIEIEDENYGTITQDSYSKLYKSYKNEINRMR